MAKPRKTRQEKIITELRRKLAVNQDLSIDRNAAPKSYEEKVRISFSPVSQSTTVQAIRLNYSYVFSDLKKTGFLTLFALAFEFVLYWLFERGGIHLIRR